MCECSYATPTLPKNGRERRFRYCVYKAKEEGVVHSHSHRPSHSRAISGSVHKPKACPTECSFARWLPQSIMEFIAMRCNNRLWNEMKSWKTDLLMATWQGRMRFTMKNRATPLCRNSQCLTNWDACFILSTIPSCPRYCKESHRGKARSFSTAWLEVRPAAKDWRKKSNTWLSY